MFFVGVVFLIMCLLLLFFSEVECIMLNLEDKGLLDVGGCFFEYFVVDLFGLMLLKKFLYDCGWGKKFLLLFEREFWFLNFVLLIWLIELEFLFMLIWFLKLRNLFEGFL